MHRPILNVDKETPGTLAAVVGSGIFSTPGVVLGYTGSVGLALLAWVLGAALAAGSALCYAEAWPHTTPLSHSST